MRDYPAAHSMDTEWFAVDADGNVGVFDTGEDGALPNDAAKGLGPGEPSFDVSLFHAFLRAREIASGDLRQTEEEISKIVDSLCLPRAPGRQVLVAVRDSEPERYRDERGQGAAARELISGGDYHILREAKPRVGLSRAPVGHKRLRELEKSGRLVALLSDDLLREWSFGDAPGGREVFAFGRPHGEEPGLYERRSVPEHPIRAEDLPEALREDLGALRLAIRFEEAERVHLADHIDDDEASYWGDWTLRGFAPTGERPGAPPAARPLAPPARPRYGSALVFVLAILAFLWWLATRRH